LVRRAFCLFLLGVSTCFAADSPQRIVSLSPNTTEMLYGIGAFGRVVAVSRYCSYPPEVSKLPRVGGWQDASIESIAAQRPDLVVLTKAQEPFIADRLRTFGIRWVAVPSESLADVFTAMQQLGAATGNREQAADLERRTRSSLDAIRAATRNLPRRSVLLVVNHAPGSLSDLYAATQGSYLIGLIEIAGGRSVTTRAPTGYAKISKEAVLALNPDVILDLVHHSRSEFAEHAEVTWSDLPELKAVRTKQVYPIDDEFVVHPSQFVAHTAKLFESILHPDGAAKGAH
jgi:iron complex transport system substrate-binding protein